MSAAPVQSFHMSILRSDFCYWNYFSSLHIIQTCWGSSIDFSKYYLACISVGVPMYFLTYNAPFCLDHFHLKSAKLYLKSAVFVWYFCHDNLELKI
jgi:hypothetical protein